MTYDVVIATLNRVQALKMSLPLLRQQTVAPARVIIVDATDDHATIRAEIQAIADGCGLPVTIHHSPRKNLPFQRNLGLEHVTAPIVLMPDDDSLLYADTAEQMLALYAKDTRGQIGAVTARPVEVSPLSTEPVVYKKSLAATLKARIQPYRNLLENALVPLPSHVYARDFWKTVTIPDYIDGEVYSVVETIAGFRMSFRSDVIKRVRFDETLGYGIGYATHEDIDACMRVMASGYLLAAARRGRIYHNFFPSKRARGFNYGFAQIANYLLLSRRTIQPGTAAWRAIGRHLPYKLLLYRLNYPNAYNRSVLEGASVAWKNREPLLTATPDKLDAVYRDLCDRFIER